MKAIQVKYLGPTNVKPSRLKAWTDGGSLTISVASLDAPNLDAAARIVAEKLATKMGWKGDFTAGGLPNQDWAFTFAETREPRKNPKARDPAHRKLLKELDTHFAKDERAMKRNPTESETLNDHLGEFEGSLHSTRPVWKRGAIITLTIRGPNYTSAKETFKLGEKWGRETARSYLKTMISQARNRHLRGQSYIPNPRRRRRHLPAKVERCVRAVKKRGGAVNPYAVCQAKRNPAQHFVIHAQKGSGPLLRYTGTKFANNAAAKHYSSHATATLARNALVNAYPILRGYRVTVEPLPPK